MFCHWHRRVVLVPVEFVWDVGLWAMRRWELDWELDGMKAYYTPALVATVKRSLMSFRGTHGALFRKKASVSFSSLLHMT